MLDGIPHVRCVDKDLRTAQLHRKSLAVMEWSREPSTLTKATTAPGQDIFTGRRSVTTADPMPKETILPAGQWPEKNKIHASLAYDLQSC